MSNSISTIGNLSTTATTATISNDYTPHYYIPNSKAISFNLIKVENGYILICNKTTHIIQSNEDIGKYVEKCIALNIIKG